MRWQFAVRSGIRVALVLAAVGLILVGGSAVWIGYIMLGYLVAAAALVRVIRALREAERARS